MERCNYYTRSGARCRNGASEQVDRPTFSGIIIGGGDDEPERVTLGYCAKHTVEIIKLTGGRRVA